MKFNYIKYHNYRCFQDVKVDFKTNDQQNIALVLGANGAGKTEMLFSFQWVLYGFDFKNLREKDETPYALTSGLYHQLEIDRHSPSVDCWAELSFTHKGTEYFMRRTERFMNKNEKVDSIVNVSLSYTKDNGERTTQIKDKVEVEKILNRIIPKSILEGITFDGERMKILNIIDDSSKKVIKQVISLVTNETLFRLCSDEIKDVNGDVSRERNKINKASGNVTAEELENEIERLNDDIEDAEIGISGASRNLTKIEKELAEISQKLTQLNDAKELEQKRAGLETDLDKAKKNYNSSLDTFQKRLVDGYFLATDKLINDVKESLDNIDVPAGLTVEAVKSIMKRPKCICGCDMTDDIVQKLTGLLSTLPPDNISSNILYMANQFPIEKKRARGLLKEAYDSIRENKKLVADYKAQLAEVSSSLVTSVSETVRDLENKRNALLKEQGRLDSQLQVNTLNKERFEKRLKEAKKELDAASVNTSQMEVLINKGRVLDKFKEAIKRIEELNQAMSLISINEYLSRAYKMLSEDTGRRIYLCQYDKKEKFGLFTYLESRYQEMRTRWTNSGYIKTLEDEECSKEEIHEKIVLKVAEGKSTGQSKINSLAFAKAILEYSNEDRSDDSLKVSHDYPFLIDSPFTELTDDNLINVARYIKTFASQVLIMADDVSYEGVEQYVKPYVNAKTHLIKDKEKGISYIN